MRRCRLRLPWGAFALVLAVLGGALEARAQDPGDKLTIGDVVAAAGDQPTHIVFVHGIRTDARGASFPLQNRICAHIAGGCSGIRRVSTDVLSIIPPKNATFDGQPIWSTNDEWLASRPIVDHYVYERPHGGPVIVDEVNWWPIAFPIKCRILVATDAKLAGVDSRTLGLCAAKSDAAGKSGNPGPEYHDWIDTPSDPTAYKAILAGRPEGGGAPWANRLLKTEILDWGLSDAVMALGTTKTQFRDTIRCALQAIAEFDPHRGVVQNVAVPLTTPPLFQSPNEVDCRSAPAAEQPAHYVIVSHSLGSFMLLDTFAAATGDLRDIDEKEGRRRANSTPTTGPEQIAEAASLADELCLPETMGGGRTPMASSAAVSPAVAEARSHFSGLCLVAANSSSLYFLANQVPLLEIARIEEGLSDGKPKDTLAAWSQLVSDRHQGRPLQIIAFNDPGDVLTFETIKISGASVDNRTVRNAFRWFGLFERPDLAHVNYFTNKDVLKTMFGS